MKKKVAIYGFGEAGKQLFASLRMDQRYQVVTFFDDNPDLNDIKFENIKVYNSAKLENIHKLIPFDTVLVALPSATRQRRKLILDRLRPLKVGVKVLPSVHELFDCRVSVSNLLDFDAADLLGRDEIDPKNSLLAKNISKKNVLVTGAGGSIGSELALEITRHKPSSLILVDHSEYSLYRVNETLKSINNGVKIFPKLATICSEIEMRHLLQNYEIDTVYHAAAYKHVPLVEENPVSGIRNNVFGTYDLLNACMQHQLETFVLISTDKAVRPTSIMGASKRVAEQLVQAVASESKFGTYSMVRFGNVLNSSGSVVPLFRKQIQELKNITVTDPNVTRYFMSLGEAVRLVIQAGAMSNGGEVFVLDMGKPIKIYDLALRMIELSGLVFGTDISIDFTGLRPGEKLHEELLINDREECTEHPRIFKTKENLFSMSQMKLFINKMKALFENNSLDVMKDIRDLLQAQVEGYRILK